MRPKRLGSGRAGFLIAVPSNRDLYTVGLGVDAIQVINAIATAAEGKQGCRATSKKAERWVGINIRE